MPASTKRFVLQQSTCAKINNHLGGNFKMSLSNTKGEAASLDARFNELDCFLGDLAEYNQFKRVEHVIMDTGRAAKFVYAVYSHDRELRHKLLGDGCVGLIHCVPLQTSLIPRGEMSLSEKIEFGGYGVPVKRKE